MDLVDLVEEVLVAEELVADGKGGKMCLSWFKKKTEHGEKVLQCPRCGRDMKKLKKLDVVIDHCEKCGGMWLDDREIEKLYGYYKKDRKIKKVKKGKN